MTGAHGLSFGQAAVRGGDDVGAEMTRRGGDDVGGAPRTLAAVMLAAMMLAAMTLAARAGLR
ncbi:hypothetical protein [Subtercola sp. YIM 133946]|uniref:hypothetical protein n=1 Tax=Subtercola sp. YIM 133946 TaxID=3118909 RepID=UPI002F957C9D